MALSALIEWDVRTTGSDSNGGGFKSGASGTDYSLQDAAQVTYADLVIDGADNTKVTSAGFPFAATAVGNILNVTGGTGFTTGRYEVTAVASNVATLDRAVGTVASTGGAGKLGGSLLTIATVASAVTVNGQKVHIKAGTYTLTAAAVMAGFQQKWYGFSATHLDRSTKPLITTSTASINLLEMPASCDTLFDNITFSNTHATAASRKAAIAATGNFPNARVVRCEFDGFLNTLDQDGGNFASLTAAFSRFGGEVGTQCMRGGFRAAVYGCLFHDHTNVSGYAVWVDAGGSVSHCVFSRIAGAAVHISETTHGAIVANNSFNVCVTALDAPSDTTIAVNNIFWDCGVAWNNGSLGFMSNNAFGSNGTDGDGSFRYQEDRITLSADPFTDAAGDDYSLNATAGGGALLTRAGFGYLGEACDVGAVQAQGGGASAYTFIG
jgi:hypothetical protein